MARTSRSAPSRRGRVTRRGPIRRVRSELQHVANLQPVSARIIHDPPPVPAVHQGTITLPFICTAVKGTSTATVKTAGLLLPPIIQFGWDTDYVKPDAGSFTVADISKCLATYMGGDSTVFTGKSIEISFNKFSYWGPSFQTVARNLCISLGVNIGTSYSGSTVTDVGTETRRPRVSLRLPYNWWYSGSATTAICAIDPDYRDSKLFSWPGDDKQVYDLGTLHVSLTYRVKRAI